jgi:hypothetical protein
MWLDVMGIVVVIFAVGVLLIEFIDGDHIFHQ